MASEQQIQLVIMSLARFRACQNCGTRFRFGDLDCPHCGLDLEPCLRDWAAALLEELGISRTSS
ncbi:MAG: hypothetical protein FJ316_00570 [SAR202 cluster bacterium]|nr:hypothetical protein [SAR202 cluster bacterium]